MVTRCGSFPIAVFIFLSCNIEKMLGQHVITGSTFIANETNIYYNTTINCIDNEDCVIICLSSAAWRPASNSNVNSTCSHSTINCPSDKGKSCSVTCKGSQLWYDYFSCTNLNIKWVVGNPNSLQCDTSCDNVPYPPPIDNNAPLIVDCESSAQCYGTIISCPLNASCDVRCNHNTTCSTATINCPINSPCNVLCNGTYSCEYANINWSLTPGLGSLICEGYDACTGVRYPPSVNDTTAYIVTFSKEYEMEGLHITCPKHAQCDIICTGAYSCYEVQLDCPVDAPCNVVCNANACYDMDIRWSMIPGIGSLSCDGSYSCKGVNFPPPDPNIPLTINCDADYKCSGSTILCPSNAQCTLICIGTSACQGRDIVWPSTPGLGSLICDGAGACSYINFPPPDPNTPYTLTCDKSGECTYAKILCPENADCSVVCTGNYACAGLSIIWPTNRNVVTTLTCAPTATDPCSPAPSQYSDKCSNPCALITTPTYIEPTNINTDYIINCSTAYQCYGYVIDCPLNGGCYIHCNAEGACKNMIINWVDGQPNNLFCADLWSCAGVKSIKPYDQNAPFIFNCTSYPSQRYRGATFDCPTNADCTIICNTDCGCVDSIINGPINHQLTIISVDAGLMGAEIHAESVQYL
eukprot:148008_1